MREILYKNIAIIVIQHSKFILLTPLAILPILLGEIHSIGPADILIGKDKEKKERVHKDNVHKLDYLKKTDDERKPGLCLVQNMTTSRLTTSHTEKSMS